MKLLIAGSTSLTNRASINKALHAAEQMIGTGRIELIIVGKHRGVDTYAEAWARLRNIPYCTYSENQNEAKCNHADALLVLWDGKSVGTRTMIDMMEQRGKPHLAMIMVPDEIHGE